MKKIWIVLCVVFLFSIGIFFGVSVFKTPRVAILYIATGRYIVFWDDFYKSAEKNLLPGFEKHYFVFTDDTEKKLPENATRISQKALGWPNITLDRFELFLTIEEVLKKYDYIYFFNANAEIVSPVGKEILPTKQQGITVACHPNFYRSLDNLAYPYERRRGSMAYIPVGQGVYYVQGSFNGGRSKEFLELIHTLYENTQTDKKNNIVALWHDESHLNRYILNKNPLVLPPNYTWALFDLELHEVFKDNLKIVMRSKSDFGGVDYLRGGTSRRADEEPDEALKSRSFLLNHIAWKGYLIPVSSEKYCLFYTDYICGKVKKEKDGLTVLWETYPPEKFIFDKSKNQYFLPPDQR